MRGHRCGAIVLGLALQNTLADVFAGMAVGVDAPFSVGDRIQIDDKIEGQVVQVAFTICPAMPS